ncbi:MAG TPA: GNAT family N-acetyltransferase [Candidatus Baltobacteraceae bacterium]|nr:GNAT family N-acetyltransferase [Candidatus Baltobacteraceae bacterium]
MSLEIARVGADAVASFYRENEREALKSFYDFAVVWHEQLHDFAAIDDGQTLGAATIRIAASLAHVERIIVAPSHRRHGIGRALLQRAEDVANYYNCHKMTTLTPHLGSAQNFFEACDYKIEAVLPQHTFKLDTAVLRKFLL